MPFLLVFFWLLHNFIGALTLVTSPPAVASSALTFSETPLAKGQVQYLSITYLTELTLLSATVPQTSTSNLTSIPPFDFRVPYSSIELHVVPTYPIDSHDLAWILLTSIDFIGERLRRKGDGPLAPKNDPFGMVVPSQHINFTVQSVQGQRMTWGVLQPAVEGLYRVLPGEYRYYAARFQIRDYEEDFQWGFGEIWNMSMTNVAIGNDTSSVRVTESTANDDVLAA